MLTGKTVKRSKLQSGPGETDTSQSGQNRKRWWLLAIGVGALGTALGSYWFGPGYAGGRGVGGSRELALNSVLRVGIVMLAIWLALPALNKPMRWLPPGAAVMCLVGIGIIAAQPRLLVVIVPAIGFLLTIGWLVRIFQISKR